MLSLSSEESATRGNIYFLSSLLLFAEPQSCRFRRQVRWLAKILVVNEALHGVSQKRGALIVFAACYGAVPCESGVEDPCKAFVFSV